MEKFDVIVIGLGPAGMPVSTLSGLMGLKVLAIEKRKHGGECLNYGCIPSKFLVKASEAAHSMKNLQTFGLATNGVLDNSGVMQELQSKVSSVSELVKDKDVFKNITYLNDPKGGHFISKNVVGVGDKKFYGKKIFISVGTSPSIPNIKGIKSIDKERILTNTEVFNQDKLPESLIIVGAGVMGLELGQSFHRLGVKVSLIDVVDNILTGHGDPEVSTLLEDMLNKEGLKINKGTQINKIEQNNNTITVTTNKGEFKGEKVLFATGRKINLDGLKLENAGIKYSKKGIHVNKYLQTSQKNIYANGDCNGTQQLTHAAMHQGMLSIMNAMMPLSIFRIKFKKYVVPSTIFTFPQVAQVGLTLQEAKDKKIKFDIVKKPFEDYGRTTIDGTPEGFVKVLVTKTGKILGVTIIGENAGEMINEWSLAVQNKIRMHQIMMTQHSFPTVTMLTKMASQQWMMNKMENMGDNWMKKMFKMMI